MREIRVLIADDHPVVIKGLKAVLSEQENIKIVAEAGNGAEVLEKILENRIDLAIIDLSMPGRSGLEVLSDIMSIHPGMPVLIFSIHEEEKMAKRLIKAGAKGYLNKLSDTDELIRAINQISEGKIYISIRYAEKLLGDLTSGNSAEPPHEKLSDREFEVFKFLTEGMKLTEIASVMSLSPKTVTTYKSRIKKKLNASGKDDLIRYSKRYNLFSAK